MLEIITIAVAVAVVAAVFIAARLADRWQEQRDLAEVDQYLRSLKERG